MEQIGLSTIPIDDKIEYCQQIYRKWGTPAIFKISPMVDRIFDRELERRDYAIEHTTQVMVMDLEGFHSSAPRPDGLLLEQSIPRRWIEGLFELKGTTNAMHRKIVPSMYRAIPMDTIAASIWQNGKIVATGLGILDREYIGLYASTLSFAAADMPSDFAAPFCLQAAKRARENPICRWSQATVLPKTCIAESAFSPFTPTGSAFCLCFDFPSKLPEGFPFRQKGDCSLLCSPPSFSYFLPDRYFSMLSMAVSSSSPLA